MVPETGGHITIHVYDPVLDCTPGYKRCINGSGKAKVAVKSSNANRTATLPKLKKAPEHFSIVRPGKEMSP